MAKVASEVPRNLPVPNPFRDRSLRTAVDGKTILITGASSGIGEASAIRVGVNGAKVLLVSRTKEKLDAVRKEIEDVGGEGYVYPCDLTDTDAIGTMAEQVIADHGGVDILVNNAGMSIRRSIAHSYDRLHDFERTIQLNYLGAVALILKVLPGMRERLRPPREHLVDGRSNQHAPFLGIRCLQERARWLLALDRLGDRR